MDGGIDDLVAGGDKVACRWSGNATHKGELRGVAATGKAITLSGIVIYRIASGKIQEEWDYTDLFGLMQQLGVGPLQGQRYALGECASGASGPILIPSLGSEPLSAYGSKIQGTEGRAELLVSTPRGALNRHREK